MQIEKTLMSPNVLNSKKIKITNSKERKYLGVKNKIKEYLNKKLGAYLLATAIKKSFEKKN